LVNRERQHAEHEGDEVTMAEAKARGLAASFALMPESSPRCANSTIRSRSREADQHHEADLK
jgi:hypothetical protein